jgi:transposase
MKSCVWIGIDVGKREFSAAIARDVLSGNDWRHAPCKSFEHSVAGMRALLAWLRAQGVETSQLDGLCIESTGRLAQQFATLAKGRLGAISIINPARSKAFAASLGNQHKNDAVDARLIAYFGQHLRPRPQAPRDKTCVQLRELSRAYERLQGDLLAHRQRLADGPECPAVCALYKRLIRQIEKEMSRLQERIQKLIEENDALMEDAARITTVPGLGPRVAQSLLAEFGDLRQYNRDEIVALAGLYPRQHQSGSSVHKAPRMAKAGKANLRAVLYMAAMSARQCNPKLKAFAQRLQDNGKAPMQILVAIMRKLLLIAHALVVNDAEYDPNFQSIQEQS